MSVSVHNLQIAREVEKFNDYTVAKFFLGDTQDLICSAWFQSPDIRKVQGYGYYMSVEKASAVSIAIQMAIEWLTEQK